jgi:hypothetical protein
MTNCKKGCYEVGVILYSDEDAEETQKDELSKYEAYEQIWPGDYGHINYALAAYCVDIGHIECLKKLYTDLDLEWHLDLADCAIEKDNLECLKFIVEVMGDVKICSKNKNVRKNCKEYVKQLKINNARKHGN